MRVLKNPTKTPVTGIFNGREISIPARYSLTIKDPDSDKKADYLLQTFGFLQDITDRIEEDKKKKGGSK